MKKFRAAAAQFAAGNDVPSNLKTVLRMIDRACDVRPDLLVLPEFSNHCSWYRDQAHAFEVAVPLGGDFLGAIAGRARQHGVHVMVNVTLRRVHPTVTGTNLLFGPSGDLVATSDKQVLMGNENNFLTRASAEGPIVDLPFGRFGMYSCMDGVIFETPRCLALRGAQVLGNSLNSFALDEASLHVPVRAAENRVFVVAANKVGPLVPEDLLEQVAAKIKVAPRFLHGAGESQIVSPTGEVLAIASHDTEDVIFADIDPSQALDKRRSTGTDVFRSRRPSLYTAIAKPPNTVSQSQATSDARNVSAALVEIAEHEEPTVNISALQRSIEDARRQSARLVVLPELPFLAGGRVEDVDTAARASHEAIAAVRHTLAGSDALVAFSIVDLTSHGPAHAGVVLRAEGEVLRQRTLHPSDRHPWARVFGDAIVRAETPHGVLAVATGEDTIYPEVFRLAAIQNVEVALCPTHIVEPWEMRTGIRERAAENRMNVLVASRTTPVGRSAAATVSEDFTLWTDWKTRPFDGCINDPVYRVAEPGPRVTSVELTPANAHNRMVTQKTDVVSSRPHWLLSALVS